MTPVEKARWDLEQHRAGNLPAPDDRWSNTPDDARRAQARNWDRWDSYDRRETR